MSTRTVQARADNYKRANRTASDIGYIVIHYTGNKGDTAAANGAYFARERVGTSAHYFVDESNVVCSVQEKDVAWHCGTTTGYYHPACRNSNSIGIEICMLDKQGGIRTGSIDNAAALTRTLMRKYNILPSHVLRHYDITRKNCPAPMVADPALWAAYKTAVQEGDEVVSKTSVLIDGKPYTVDAINKDDTNYVKLRDLAQAGYTVAYDAKTDMPIVTAPDTRIVVTASTDDTDALRSAGLSEQTIDYLLRYRYGDDLVRKLAAAMK